MNGSTTVVLTGTNLINPDGSTTVDFGAKPAT